GQRLAAPVAQVGIRMARRAPDAPADLVQLGKAQIVRVLDDERIRVRNIDAGLDDGRADQNIDFAVRHRVHDRGDLLLRHFAVYDADARVRQALLQLAGAPLDGFHAVVQVVHLPAAGQLAPNRIE